MSVQIVTILQHDTTTQLADKLPQVRIHGTTLVRLQRGNNGVDIIGDSPEQLLKLMRALRELVQATITELENGPEKEVVCEQPKRIEG